MPWLTAELITSSAICAVRRDSSSTWGAQGRVVAGLQGLLDGLGRLVDGVGLVGREVGHLERLARALRTIAAALLCSSTALARLHVLARRSRSTRA